MKQIPEFPQNRDLTVEDGIFLSDLLGKRGIRSSDFSLYNLLGWYLQRPPKLSRIGAHYVISVEGPDGSHLFFPPLGEGNLQAALKELLPAIQASAGIMELSYVPKALADEIKAVCPPDLVIPQRGDFDYVYNRQELAELSGRKFHQKKNFVNRVLQEYHPEVELLDGNLDAAEKLLEEWYQANPSPDLSVQLEHLAAGRMLPRLREIGGLGIVVRVEGKLVGLAAASPITKDCWVITLEKADRSLKGMYQFLNWATANRLPPEVVLINRETDLDIEGLRSAKLSYHPAFLEEKFRFHWNSMPT